VTAATKPLEALDEHVLLTAAVSTHFDPLKVLGAGPLLDDARVDVVDGLAAVCEEVDVAGSDYRQWAMRPEARRRALQSLAKRPDLKNLLDGVQVAPDDAFATYLSDGLRGADLGQLVPAGGAPPPGPVALDPLLKAVRFLDGLPGVPPTGDLERRVRRQIALEDADKALEAVAPRRLVGRDQEYAALVDYCHTMLPPGGDWVPSFVLEGPGGVGKSALVSKFVTDQRRLPGAPPLIYLDFDRASLIEATHLDLTLELSRQLGLADATLEQPLADFQERSRSLLGGQVNASIDIGGGAAAAAQRDLASILAGWPRREQPITLVLDTFEEVAIRGVTAVRDVLQWVADVRDAVQLPQVHVVVVGRAVTPDAPHLTPAELAAMFNARRSLELEDLSEEKATELLQELGVEPGLAARLPHVFGGNPLVLKLLQRFVATNEPGAVEQLVADGEKARRDAPSGEVGLRFVYERILNRIKTPRVKALAYPGVVLRRVTPELILEVLAPSCGDRLDVKTLADAQAAFAELAEHVWLVNRVGPDAVEHRRDVRRLLVPGLENSHEVDTRAIHRAAAAYYARRPDTVPEDVARIEEIYHLGFLDELPRDLSKADADDVVRRLGEDIDFWPIGPRAAVKSLAGRHDELTEDEVASLGRAQQVVTRGVRLEKGRASYDVGSTAFEEAQLADLVGPEPGGTDEEGGDAIPDARWGLLFDRGDFAFMTESSRVLTAFDRYFAPDHPPNPSSSPTHEHPWYIALAVLMSEQGDRPLFSDPALSALDSSWDEARRYGAALAALAGDERAHRRIIARVRKELPHRIDLSRVDDVVVLQAAAAGGDLDELGTTCQLYSCDYFRLSHVGSIATAAGNPDLAARAGDHVDRYARQRPDTRELNSWREQLARADLNLVGAKALRAAPTTLSFLYGAIRTIATPLDRAALLDVVSGLEQRSVFWPSDLTAAALDSTLRKTATPSDLTGLIETADRCGLLVELVEAVAARTRSRFSGQLAAGIRRIEGLLFPYARPDAELVHVR
jgi:hypothetical protein